MESVSYLISWANTYDLERYKKILFISLIVVFGILIPSFVVADELGGYDTEKLIGMAGVSDSNLVIGRDGVSNSFLDIAMGGTHFNESDPAFQIVSLAPLLYVAMLLFVLFGLLTHMSLQAIIMGVVAIYLAISLLTGMQTTITDLLR